MDDRFFDRCLGLLVLSVLLIAVFQIVQPFIFSLLWGVILAVATWPLHEMIKRRLGGSQTMAALVMTVLTLLVVGIPLVLIASSLFDQVNSVADLVSDLTQTPAPPPPEWLVQVPVVGRWLDGRWRAALSDVSGTLAQARPMIANALTWLLGKSVGLLGALGEVLLALIVTCILYFQGNSGARLLRRVVVRLGGPQKGALLDVAVSTIRSVALGVVGTALIQGILATIGFIVADVPGPLLLGLLLFVGTVAQLPAGALMLPVAIWLYVKGETTAAVALGAYGVLFVGTIDNVIRPFLIGHGNSLPMLLILVGVVGGLLAYGFIGIFLGATLLAVVYTLLIAWLDEREGVRNSRLAAGGRE